MVGGPARTDRFRGLPPVKPDGVFKLDAAAKKDSSPNVVNLVIGAYRDETGKPYVLKTVRKAEQIILDRKLNKEYLPIDGNRAFSDEAVKLLLGPDMPPKTRIAASQTLSGTGACRVGAEFFFRSLPPITPVYISDPTWANHRPIFSEVGFKDIRAYRYFDPKTNGVNIQAMVDDLTAAPNNSVVLLHLCAHNPTGADPNDEEWERIADVFQAKGHYPFFDCAYQGYASGSLNRDAFAARLFMKRGIEFLAAMSFAKNMGLYGERVGCLIGHCGSNGAAALMQGMMKKIIRPMYSNPPLHGARIVQLILSDKTLRAEWKTELTGMAERIIKMRRLLYEELLRRRTPGTWDHIVNQIGMFSYTGLSREQCERLQKEYHIYIMLSGRASMAGLTVKGAQYFAFAIDAVVRSTVPKAKM